ncbi:MAG: hypothetical protein JRI91_11555, partial [Deltaproteobacteria bacterium]|nr:hypothetical protein [Deltaproteobacteria bacterium]
SLIKIFSAGDKGFSDLAEVSLYYEESIVIIHEPVDKHYLIIFCDTESKLNRLKRPINQIKDDLKQAIENRPENKKVKPVPVVKTSRVNSGNTGLQAERLLNSSPMSKSLQAMRVSLAKVMGPVAKIIFIDALNNWMEIDQPSFASIPSLIDILGNEINDTAKFKDYRGGILPYIEKQTIKR